LGGLALLLFGLGNLTSALKGVAGDKVRVGLARLTSNRFKAILTGALTTAVLQSSTVTTVVVVGFVGAGLISLLSSLGVILGSNIGSTITAQVVAFDVADWALILVAMGFAVMTVVKGDRIRGWGGALLGLGLVFLGMQTMSRAMAPLSDHAPFVDFIASGLVVGVLAGAVFTALVQSSAATTVLAIVLASQGIMPLRIGVAIVIGANIGTCVTAALAAIGKSREAHRAAAAHVLFNLAGAAIWLVLVDRLVTMTVAISPSYPDLQGAVRLAAEAPRQLANAHTIFNVANVILFAGLLGPTAKLLNRLLPDRAGQTPPASQPRYLEPELVNTPALALASAEREVRRLGDLVLAMLRSAPWAVLAGPRTGLERLEAADQDVDALYEHIVEYLARVAAGPLTGSDSQRLLTLLEASNSLESIADLVEINLVGQGKRRLDSGVRVSGETLDLLTDLFALVTSTVADAVDALISGDPDAAERVTAGKDAVNHRVDAARGHQVRRLLSPERHRPVLYAIETDVIETIKRIEYLARHVVRPRLPEEGPDMLANRDH
jgi:phosphate:Na+ symporter